MSSLTLVRHGQAHAFEADSDRLTRLGEKQSRLLGDYWTRHRIRFDQAFCGTLLRHRQTAEAVAASGLELPPLRAVPGWNEYQADRILKFLAPQLEHSDPSFAALADGFRSAAPADRNRPFQRMFERLMQAWLDNSVTHPEVEAADLFKSRVQAALETILTTEGSRNVVVFTSGGPIGVTVQTVLGAPAKTFLDLNWRIRNASLTELTFTRGRIALDTLNNLAHLDDRADWSWR